ncbi:MAG: zinc-ribbon domain-containing protein [Oscillospiraceae bacterium]|nr:zinc-ribbon domain-containing protein [Oscillospiraceae bacterium]
MNINIIRPAELKCPKCGTKLKGKEKLCPKCKALIPPVVY